MFTKAFKVCQLSIRNQSFLVIYLCSKLSVPYLKQWSTAPSVLHPRLTQVSVSFTIPNEQVAFIYCSNTYCQLLLLCLMHIKNNKRTLTVYIIPPVSPAARVRTNLFCFLTKRTRTLRNKKLGGLLFHSLPFRR